MRRFLLTSLIVLVAALAASAAAATPKAPPVADRVAGQVLPLAELARAWRAAPERDPAGFRSMCDGAGADATNKRVRTLQRTAAWASFMERHAADVQRVLTGIRRAKTLNLDPRLSTLLGDVERPLADIAKALPLSSPARLCRSLRVWQTSGGARLPMSDADARYFNLLVTGIWNWDAAFTGFVTGLREAGASPDALARFVSG